MKSVAIIVVTYNRLNLLKECIQSLKNQTYDDRDIIVINNGSTDGTKEWLDGQDDIITITQQNFGGAGGFYTGLKYSCENEYDYSWIMDDDVIANPNALMELMKNSNLSKGFLCSKVIDLENMVCNVPAIDFQKISNGELCWPEKCEKGLIRVKTATFVSVLFPNKTVRELGLPLKEYFIWGDDLEYTRRISKKYPCYFCINSIVVHKRVMSGTLNLLKETNPNRIKNFYFAYRNGIANAKQESTKLYIKEIGKTFAISCYLLLNGRFCKSYIVLKSIIASFNFNPKVIFPK